VERAEKVLVFWLRLRLCWSLPLWRRRRSFDVWPIAWIGRNVRPLKAGAVPGEAGRVVNVSLSDDRRGISHGARFTNGNRILDTWRMYK
jgi:hypothetical protein